MKTKEELNALNNEVEALNRKLAELTDDEMKQVTGGASGSVDSLRIAPVFDAFQTDPGKI